MQTEAEASLAVATFEFPPFRAEVLRTWVFLDWDEPLAHGFHIWELDVFRGKEHVRCFETPADWLAYYAAWQQRTQHAGERSASDGATRDVPATDEGGER